MTTPFNSLVNAKLDALLQLWLHFNQLQYKRVQMECANFLGTADTSWFGALFLIDPPAEEFTKYVQFPHKNRGDLMLEYAIRQLLIPTWLRVKGDYTRGVLKFRRSLFGEALQLIQHIQDVTTRRDMLGILLQHALNDIGCYPDDRHVEEMLYGMLFILSKLMDESTTTECDIHAQLAVVIRNDSLLFKLLDGKANSEQKNPKLYSMYVQLKIENPDKLKRWIMSFKNKC
jgi:hypothetical protein